MKLFTVVLFLTLSLFTLAEEDKLKVDIYVEALCPYCRSMVSNLLVPIFNCGLDKYMDLHMYYSGNVHVDDGDIHCQHGADECFLNKVMGCGIKQKKTAREWFPFIACIEQSAYYCPPARIRRCAKKAGLSGSVILKCAKYKKGIKILKASIAKTASLNPPKLGVPWGVIDGKQIGPDMTNLTKLLCDKAVHYLSCAACKAAREFSDPVPVPVS